MPASDKIFSGGMKAQRPRSRCGNRPATSIKSVDSAVSSNYDQTPPSGHRPISSSTSLDSDRCGRTSVGNLARQNAISIDDDLIDKDMSCNTNVPRFPRPPSEPPSRPRSRRGRPVSVKGRSRSVDATTTTGMDSNEEPHPLQAQVSFSKYKLLPSIGSNSSMVGDGKSFSTESYETCAGVSDSDDILLQDLSRASLNQEHRVPEEPSDAEKDRVKLAVKLLDGTRHERWFRNTDTLGDVLAFAQSVSDGDLPPCQFCTSEVPRQVFTDMSLTVNDAGLLSRSLLHLEEV